MEDLKADGYILVVQNSPILSGLEVNETDPVSFLTFVPLPDGGFILSALPPYETSSISDDDPKSSLKTLLQHFASALTGLSVQDSSAVLYRPYAPRESLSLISF